MKGNSPHCSQTTLFQNLEDLLNPEDSLYKLSNKLPWEELEKEHLQRKSFIFDIKIIYMTIKNILVGKDVSH